jgi:4-hydroxy-tetrahydrodipicolinate reductase
MRVAVVGRGKMAEEVRRICPQESIEITVVDRLVAGDVVLHFGSGRELAHAMAACAQAGIPLIQGSTSITLPEPLPCAVVEAPNLAMVVIQMMTAIKPLAGHVKAIRESHQAGKRDVSATARMFAQQLGFVEAKIESIRDRAEQLACGVPPEFLDGHAYHWIEGERDGVQIAIALRVHGREAYARGALALARMLSGKRLEPRKYAVQEMLG